MLIGVLFVASALGAALTFGLNELNPVFLSRRDVTRFAGLPVLGTISMITTPQQRRTRRLGQAAWYGGAAVLVIATGVMMAFSAEGASVLQGLIRDTGA
jgi:hypothetical protein